MWLFRVVVVRILELIIWLLSRNVSKIWLLKTSKHGYRWHRICLTWYVIYGWWWRHRIRLARFVYWQVSFIWLSIYFGLLDIRFYLLGAWLLLRICLLLICLWRLIINLIFARLLFLPYLIPLILIFGNFCWFCNRLLFLLFRLLNHDLFWLLNFNWLL